MIELLLLVSFVLGLALGVVGLVLAVLVVCAHLGN